LLQGEATSYSYSSQSVRTSDASANDIKVLIHVNLFYRIVSYIVLSQLS